jgi:hypothetical protein
MGILFFKWQAPEAARVVSQYCYGDGTQLRLEPDYIKASPVVRRAMAEVPAGESRLVRFKQDDDFRLSLALNPFTLSHRQVNGANWYRISQLIQFDQPNSGAKVKTELRFSLFHVKVRDAYIGILNCKPFIVSCEWEE